MLWIARTGSPWRDLPEVFGKWNAVFKRLRLRVKAELSGAPDLELAMVDGTIVNRPLKNLASTRFEAATGRTTVRGTDKIIGSLLSYVDIEDRIPARRPLRQVKRIVDEALARLDAEFDRLYAAEGRPSIAPERLMRASLIQILFSVRSERQLVEQMQYTRKRWGGRPPTASMCQGSGC